VTFNWTYSKSNIGLGSCCYPSVPILNNVKGKRGSQVNRRKEGKRRSGRKRKRKSQLTFSNKSSIFKSISKMGLSLPLKCNAIRNVPGAGDRILK